VIDGANFFILREADLFLNRGIFSDIIEGEGKWCPIVQSEKRSEMGTKDTEAAVAYQNKDIVSKLFGDRMKGKSLSLFGLETDLKVVDVKPTNIPIVQARELRMDNLFELEDGSVAVLDYESEYRKTNFTKYGRYIMDVIDRYLKEGKEPDIHMMVLYTADIEKSNTILKRTSCSIQVEACYLTGIPSEEWLRKVKEGIDENRVTDEELMHLVILPLTYKGEEKKQQAIRECVELARQIPDKGQETFVLAGILTFTDKVISEETRRYIKEVIGMTQVGKMLMEEGRREGRQEGRREGRQEGRREGRQEAARRTARNMLKRGDSPEVIAEILELPVETIKAWEQEVCTVV
jgi:hypothetical protein